MIPHFTNTAGLWALLAIPLIIAIHFLQHRTKEQPTATLFLLEALSPENREGTFWDRLRTSRPFWMQILAALLIAWVLAAPAWPRRDASQTVVFVLDGSADMAPFREEAVSAVSRDMETIRRTGIPAVWVLMDSRPSSQPFYRGTDSRKALQAMDSWQPHAATHDAAPALRTAAAIAGPGGITRLITSTPRRVPSGQSAQGVGRPLDNTGFVGITAVENPDSAHWRIAVKNNSTAPVRTSVSIHLEKGLPPRTQPLQLNPGAVAEFEFHLPPECDRATLQLPPDAFPADDTLLLVRTIPKAVPVHMDLPETAFPVFRNIINGLPGFTTVPAPHEASLRVVTEEKDGAQLPKGPAIILSGKGRNSSGNVTAERHPLTDGLNWSGLLVPSIGGMTPGEGASVLLWQQEAPLAWVENNQLFLNWSWRESNAERVPAPLLMIRRFMKTVQNRLPGTGSGNLPGGTLLPLPSGGRIIHTLPGGERREGTFSGRLPEEAGSVEILPANGEVPPLFRGTVWFSDARMGDFSHSSTFDTGLPPATPETLRQMRPDPFASLWLALAGLALIVSWLPSTPSRPCRS